MLSSAALRRIVLFVGGSIICAGLSCPPPDSGGTTSKTPQAYAGTVQAAFANRSIPISQRSGAGRFRWAGVDQNEPQLAVYQGILPGFPADGITEVTVDLASLLSGNAQSTESVIISGRVITSDGRVIDLAQLFGELTARPAGLTGIIITFQDSQGAKEYEINFDANGVGSSSFVGNLFAGAVSIVLRQVGGAVIDTGTGSVNAPRVEGPVNGGTLNKLAIQLFLNGQQATQMQLNNTAVVAGNVDGNPDLEYALILSNADLQTLSSGAFSSLAIVFRDKADVPGGAMNASQINGFLAASAYAAGLGGSSLTYYCNCGNCPSFRGSVTQCTRVPTRQPAGTINLTLAGGRLFGAFDFTLTDSNNNQIRAVGSVNLPQEFSSFFGLELPPNLIPLPTGL